MLASERGLYIAAASGTFYESLFGTFRNFYLLIAHRTDDSDGLGTGFRVGPERGNYNRTVALGTLALFAGVNLKNTNPLAAVFAGKLDFRRFGGHNGGVVALGAPDSFARVLILNA